MLQATGGLNSYQSVTEMKINRTLLT